METIEKKKFETKSKIKFGSGSIKPAEFVGLLPITIAGKFITLKLNVIDDDISLLFGIEAIEKLKVTLDFPNNLMWTPEESFKLTRSSVGQPFLKAKVEKQKL